MNDTTVPSGQMHSILFMFSKLLDYFQDVDAQVTFEDQQKINKFARCNHRLQDVKEELAAKQVKMTISSKLISILYKQ